MVPIRPSVASLCLLAISLPLVYGQNGGLGIEVKENSHKVTGNGFQVVTKNIAIIRAETFNGGKSTVLLQGIPPGTFYQGSAWWGKNTRGEKASVEIKAIPPTAWAFTPGNEDQVELHFMLKPRQTSGGKG